MRRTDAALVLALAASLAPGAAGSVSMAGQCRIVAGSELLAKVDGASSLCAEIERAIARRAPHARYDAQISVLSTSRLSAKIIVGGEALPEQKFAVMDRQLDAAAIARFAQSLAEAVSHAARK
jgi:hypothetical protein